MSLNHDNVMFSLDFIEKEDLKKQNKKKPDNINKGMVKNMVADKF